MSDEPTILTAPASLVYDGSDNRAAVEDIGHAALVAVEAVADLELEAAAEGGMSLADCKSHESELQCFGALVIHALAQHGLVVTRHAEGAALIRAVNDARAGKGARA